MSSSLVPPGSLPLDDIRLLLSQPTTWRLEERLIEKATPNSLSFPPDSPLPDLLKSQNPLVRLAIVLAASSFLTSGESGAVIALTLINLFNSLPPITPAAPNPPTFESSVYDLSASTITDEEFAAALTSVLEPLSPNQIILARPYITTATVLGSAALAEKLWDYLVLAISVWAELQGSTSLSPAVYSRENAPLYVSLTAQRLTEVTLDSKLLRKTGSDFLAESTKTLAPLLNAIANIRQLIAKSFHFPFDSISLQSAAVNLKSGAGFLLQFLASLEKSTPLLDIPLNRLTLALADQLGSFYTKVLLPTLSERQAAIPKGRPLPLGLITREFVKGIADSGLSLLTTFPVFKGPESKKSEIPKEPIGTRDLQPKQMRIREKVLEIVTSIFKRHGAVTIETPVFELRAVLTEKYGEESKQLIYNLEDQGGELLSLRYDLTVPFARYIATHGVNQMKRYQIAKVYRRDKPQVERGRFREFYQCDFDIAGPSGLMIADAEVLAVFSEILTEIGALAQFNYTIDVSHRGLLALIVAISDVPKEKFRSVCSSVDKLDKVSWDEVRSELINSRGLRSDSVEKLHRFIELAGEPRITLESLVERLREEYQTRENGAALFEKEATPLINELNLLFNYLEALKVLPKIRLNLSLARGLDYYTGLIFEAAAEGKPGSDVRVGSIVGGGRYSDLVGMFSGKQVPAVGGSLGIERVFALLEDRLTETIAAVDTEVFVCSVAQNFTKERLEIASELWSAGIPAEFSYKEKPDAKTQFGQAAGCGAKLAVTIAPDEVANGTVKVKILAENREITVPRVDFLATVKSLLGR